MTDIEIHGVIMCIETIPLKLLQRVEKYTESNLKNIQKELERRKNISILALAIQKQEL